jgi:hypothetical protein
MLKRTSGGDNDTELNELTVAPIRVPSSVTVVTTATPVGKSPRASLKLRSVNVIWRALIVASRLAAWAKFDCLPRECLLEDSIFSDIHYLSTCLVRASGCRRLVSAFARPNCHRICSRIVQPDHATAFHGHGSVAMMIKTSLQPTRRACQRASSVAFAYGETTNEVSFKSIVNDRCVPP